MGEKWDSDVIVYLKDHVRRKALETPRKTRKLHKKKYIMYNTWFCIG